MSADIEYLQYKFHIKATYGTANNETLTGSCASTYTSVKNQENCHVLVNQFHGNFHSKNLSCMKIKSVFRDVK